MRHNHDDCYGFGFCSCEWCDNASRNSSKVEDEISPCQAYGGSASTRPGLPPTDFSDVSCSYLVRGAQTYSGPRFSNYDFTCIVIGDNDDIEIHRS